MCVSFIKSMCTWQYIMTIFHVIKYASKDDFHGHMLSICSPLLNIPVISTVFLLWILLLWTFVYTFLCKYMLLFLLMKQFLSCISSFYQGIQRSTNMLPPCFTGHSLVTWSLLSVRLEKGCLWFIRSWELRQERGS